MNIPYLKNLVACGALGLAALGLPAQAIAQAYPTKPVKMVVAFEPGGATDILARLLAAELSQSLGQQVVVENRSGGGGNIGANMVAKSEPDGYTLHFGAAGNIAINPSLFKNMPLDPAVDFVPVAELDVRGLDTRYRWPGIGAPLAASLEPVDENMDFHDFLAPWAKTLRTALVRFDHAQEQLAGGHLQARLELKAPGEAQTVQIEGRDVPLEVETSAALALMLAESPL